MAMPPMRSVRGVLAVLALGLALLAAAPAPADDGAPRLSIAKLADPGGAMTLEDVQRADAQFAPVAAGSINLGYERSAIWLKLDIASPETRDMLLSLSPNIIDFLDVHVLGEGGRVQTWLMGDHRPLDGALSGRDDLVPLHLVADASTRVYLRLAAVATVMSLQLALYAPEEHTFRTGLTGLVAGGWFGAMAVLLIIQLVFYYYDRKPYFVLLALSTLMAMLVYFGTLGLSRVFLFPAGGGGNDIFTATTSWLGISASALAGRSILELPRRAPWLDRLFIAGVAFGLAGVGFAVAGQNMAFAPVAQLVIIGLASLGALHALRTVSAADASTHLRAAAFVVLWAGLVLMIAQRAGLGTLPDWVAHSYATSCVVYTVLLTGALAQRVRAAEAVAQAMRAEALAAAQAAEKRATALVAARTRELASAKQVAEEALAAELDSQRRQVHFMEVISHQYRTPLAAIRTHVANIELSLPAADTANRQRLGRMRRGIARLVEVLEVNLSRSRLQGPAFAPRREACQPAQLAEAAAARARDLLNATISVTVAPRAAGVLVLADADMLSIALINLLENAAKFARPGADAPITLAVDAMAGEVALAVTDRGIGIPEEARARIFDADFRAANTGRVAGTGAGLSLVARTVAAHGGRIEVHSAMGEGTTIRLLLPEHVVTAESAPAPAL